MSDEREILSALIDREPVDPDVLARILEVAANRAVLVDFVRVRAEAQADEADGSDWRPSAVLMASRRHPAAWWRAAAAAVLVIVGMGAGWWLSTREAPPEAVRVVQFDRALPFQ
jgi:hypothetical protein